ncbi:hypothetical protein [Bradyrhizobium sp. USDA 3315]
MPSLSEIEKKIAALRQRYAELDAKSIQNGKWDGAALSAMTVVEAEIKRLERDREKALVSDLIGEVSTEQTKRHSPPPRAASLPMPVFATKNAELCDPLVGLERLPKTDEDRVDLWLTLSQWCCEQVNSDLEGRQKALDQNIPVAFTQGLFRSLIVQLGALQAEYRWLVAMGRDRRKSLEETLLKRIEALEARPQLKYEGVWSGEKVYGAGMLVTDGGSMFHANRATIGERPGSGSDTWTLAVKRGRDGRDVK